MKRFLQVLIFFIAGNAFAQGNLKQKCEEFNQLNTFVRDSKIEKDKAKARFSTLLNEIENELSKLSFVYIDSSLYFPMKGYNLSAVGGKNGNGYVPGNYSYFDGNAHTGHAAQDIFIRDTNQDSKDDLYTKDVPILSMSAGVVIACEPNWDINSNLRGGKYIWVFDPLNHYLYYYAHQKKIIVKPGDWVKAGQEIGLMGRTGKNAYQKRSPTHLHLMVLKLDSNYMPKPINAYPVLKMGRLQKWY
ncbi:MAG: peptidase M23 [Bacteroidetes bacterium B1(2017)]|nr:MAG: peptidase M23 [Bacteroidetes bacterium B1(2017)]